MIAQRRKEAKAQRREGGIPFGSGIRVFLFFVPFLFLVQTSSAWGAMPLPPDSAASWRPLDTLWSDFRTTFTDAWLLAGRPLYFDRTDWMITGGVVSASGLLMATDAEIRREMQSLRGSDGDHITDVGNAFGENEAGLLIAGLLYLPGFVLNEPKLRLMGRHVGQTLLYAATVGVLIKGSLGRHRPFLGEGPYKFSGPWQSDDAFLSLPSGHTTVAFSIASSLSADIDNPYVTVGLYSAATLTALSRMYVDRHWSSDVFVAAAISSAIGYGTVNLHKPSEEESTSSLLISPTLNGITLLYAF
ncbi:MAG: phosphatase PAP2 family protein [Candidatus Kapaibacterium sp.]